MAYPDNIFTALISEDGTIWEAGTGRKRQAVGVDSQREQELLNQISEIQERLDNYYEKLVELGVITPPKSAEQIAQEQAAQQAEINVKLLEAISSLQAELGELKNGHSGNSHEPREQSVGENRQSNRKTSGGSKGRDSASPEDVAGDTE